MWLECQWWHVYDHFDYDITDLNGCFRGHLNRGSLCIDSCHHYILLASFSCAAETWLMFAFWLRCCWWCGLEVNLVRHIFAKSFGFPYFLQHLARHGLALCGHASPHWHVFERVCWGFVSFGLHAFVCFSWWTRFTSSDVWEDSFPFQLPTSCLLPNSVLWPAGHQGWGYYRVVCIFGVYLIGYFG